MVRYRSVIEGGDSAKRFVAATLYFDLRITVLSTLAYLWVHWRQHPGLLKDVGGAIMKRISQGSEIIRDFYYENVTECFVILQIQSNSSLRPFEHGQRAGPHHCSVQRRH
jgi:hypothetical protein